jgi:hypothetical protein
LSVLLYRAGYYRFDLNGEWPLRPQPPSAFHQSIGDACPAGANVTAVAISAARKNYRILNTKACPST